MADSDPAPVNFFICGTCTSKLDEPSPFPDIEDTPGVKAGRANAKNSFHRCFLAGKPPDRKTIVATTCGHLFHALCLENFFQSSIGGRQCPSCKRKLTMKTQVIRLFPSAGYDELQFTGGEPQFNEDVESENADAEETSVAGADGNAGSDNNLGAVRSEANTCDLPDCEFFAQVHQTLVTDMRELKGQYDELIEKDRRDQEAIATLKKRIAEMRAENERIKNEIAKAEERNSLDVPVQNTSKKRQAE